MNNILYPRGVDSAKVIQVIETKAARGSGASEQPSRIVIQYWSLDGKLLAENDPYLREMLSACSEKGRLGGGEEVSRDGEHYV